MVEVNQAKFGLSTAQWAITEKDVSLVGNWRYRLSAPLSAPITGDIPVLKNPRPDDFPSCLYNGRIHPLLPMVIKGAIWYQGEAKAKSFADALAYRQVFADMIRDWRLRWAHELPFYFVQLANFSARVPACEAPCEQTWPYLRESQAAAPDLPSTGMAVIINVGNPNDIHPKDKQSVGDRLARVALARTYGQKRVYSGPQYEGHAAPGSEMVIRFAHTGGGLVARDRHSYVRGFQIAGADGIFHWAQAQIEGETVVVHSPAVSQPAAVRYAWENHPPGANLYNAEGLPAVPFRTDDWDPEYPTLLRP
ncbi:MAG: hypothetical protein D6722_13265 [Bacteroidetes bacterium]|nr:MAG: hypothetical protein D6722_13265 [Bacteroidota bacterium]